MTFNHNVICPDINQHLFTEKTRKETSCHSKHPSIAQTINKATINNNIWI
uniref:Uncharacterized protein n=1 Tax=Rhizophora mucronata TaxID=61149 RepID=A0A2P2PXK7_RHIMU